MDWIFKEKEFNIDLIGDEVGFIYLITNLDNGRKYVGKKLFKFSRTKILKGKKKKVKLDSDWKTYYGSNEELKEDVKKLGEDIFKREILYFCKSKSEMSYRETKEIFLRGCLESEEYYNSWVSCKIHKKNLKKTFAIDDKV